MGPPSGRVVVLWSRAMVIALADTLIELLDSPALYSTFHSNGFERVQAAFRMDKIMGRYNSLYRELGAGTPQPQVPGAPTGALPQD